jgi:hypothetical protein
VAKGLMPLITDKGWIKADIHSHANSTAANATTMLSPPNLQIP